MAQGDTDAARALGERSSAFLGNLGFAQGQAAAELLLGEVSCQTGAFANARRHFEHAANLAREIGDRWIAALAYFEMGQAALDDGDLAAARSSFVESLLLERDLGNPSGVGRAIRGLAALAAYQGLAQRAVHLDGAASQRGLEWRHSADLHAWYERFRGVARSALSTEQAATAWNEGLATPADEAIAYALAGNEPACPPGTSVSARRTDGLTLREREVAVLVARGLSNRRIGEQLVIAPKTAERHVANILAKLGLATRAQIAAWAVGQRLVKAVAEPRKDLE